MQKINTDNVMEKLKGKYALQVEKLCNMTAQEKDDYNFMAESGYQNDIERFEEVKGKFFIILKEHKKNKKGENITGIEVLVDASLPAGKRVRVGGRMVEGKEVYYTLFDIEQEIRNGLKLKYLTRHYTEHERRYMTEYTINKNEMELKKEQPDILTFDDEPVGKQIENTIVSEQDSL